MGEAAAAEARRRRRKRLRRPKTAALRPVLNYIASFGGGGNTALA